jgi:hypothetical protein
MQLKSRYVLTALAVLVVLSMATTAMAQVTFNVSSTPTARARTHGHAELIGDITFTTAGIGGTPVAGPTHTLTINYGIPLTNDEADGVGSSIEIIGSGCLLATAAADGGFLGAADAAVDADATINFALGIVTLNLQGGGACAPGDFVSVRNVHASVVGLPNALYKAQVSTSPTGGYLIQAAQDQPTVIATILDELDGGLSSAGTCLFLSDGTAITPTSTITVVENFADAVLDAAALGGGALNDVRVTLTFTGIPAGATVTVAAGGVVLTNALPTVGPVNATTAYVATSASPTITMNFTDVGATLPSSIHIDTFTFTATFSPGGATIPLAGGPITVSANVTPTGTATKVVPAVGNFPRFVADPEPAVTFCNIVPAQTNLLIPFMTAGSGFDTGISVANTTADNFAAPNGAVAQSGSILFEFWPQTGAPFTYTTNAASPGAGLTAGALASGGSYSVLLSELLADAGAPADFVGYAIVTTNFTNGHGDVFITDFAGFTSSGNVLVMNPPVAGNTRNPAPLAEGLVK